MLSPSGLSEDSWNVEPMNKDGHGAREMDPGRKEQSPSQSGLGINLIGLPGII